MLYEAEELKEYLSKNYMTNEPIFLSELEYTIMGDKLNELFELLCANGDIAKFDSGIYYFERPSRLKGGVTLSPREVARYQYIARKNQVDGYYSGYTFANQLGLTTQVPYTIEIVSNRARESHLEVYLRNQKFILRKPCIQITKENSDILQLLDLLMGWEQYVDEEVSDAVDCLLKYVKRLNISRREIEKYIGLYPAKIRETIQEMGLYNVFT